MANSTLEGTMHEIPEKLMEHLVDIYRKFSNQSNIKGLKRLKGLLDKKHCTYEQLKRIKNYFDYTDPNTVNSTEYALNGGEPMKNWVNHTLEKLRGDIYSNNKLRDDAGVMKSSDLTAPDTNRNSNPMDVPDFMSTNDLSGGLMEQVNKMKKLIKTI